MRLLPALPAPNLAHPAGAQAVLWVAAGLLLATGPLIPHLPAWIGALVLAASLWRGLIARRGWRLPNKWLCLALAFAAVGGVYLHFGTLVGRDAAVAVFTVLLGLKLLETNTARDYALLTFFGYFLTATAFLYSQSLPAALYMLLTAWVLTGALVHVHRAGADAAWRGTLRLSGTLLLQAIPFMLILFVLFPRVSTPLWGTPQSSARSGLDDHMTPGNIGRLAQSDAVALRAEFTGRLPAPAQRYWRGPVLWLTDGRTWSAGPSAAAPASVQFQAFGTPLDYSVTLEAHQKPWLFALDLPASIPAIGHLTDDFQLHAAAPLETRTRYRVRSYPSYRTGALSADERRRALQLPPAANPRTRELAAAWRTTLHTDDQLVQRALDHFRRLAFFYTLTPGTLELAADAHPVDEFLFTTRRGFCEHYAAAFVTLMRAAGVPARVVTGYQGGELNPLGNYLIVRQSDAHAWAEVWLAGRGWVRVDPTAAIAPQRVERGGALVAEMMQAAGDFAPSGQNLLDRTWLHARLRWDNLNYQWSKWVIGYDGARQAQLLSGLGLATLTRGATALGLALVFGLALLFAAYALRLLTARRAPTDAAARLYQRFCAKLAKHGISRRPSEGPLDFAARAAQRLPRHARTIQLISRLYSLLRYAPRHPPHTLTQLRTQVRAFRV